MSKEEFYTIIDHIVSSCIKLKDKYITEKNLPIDYICIFSQNEDEYNEFLKYARLIAEIVEETSTGPMFKLLNVPTTEAGNPKVLKVRKPDKTRPQRGDVDFTSNYKKLKAKYFDNNRFKRIKREKFEMLELADKDFDVLVYFSSIPPSKLAGIS